MHINLLFFSSSSSHLLFHDNEAESFKSLFSRLSRVRIARSRNVCCRTRFVLVSCLTSAAQHVFLQWPVADSTEPIPVSGCGTRHVCTWLCQLGGPVQLHSEGCLVTTFLRTASVSTFWEVPRQGPFGGMTSSSSSGAFQQAPDGKLQ